MSNCDPAEWLIALKKKNWRCDPPNEDEAVKVQREITKVAKDVWGDVVGRKVALTSPESQRTYGGGPITGPLFSYNVLGKGSVVRLEELSDPLLEPEIFYCEGKYFLAFEIPDNRYGKKWRELNWLQILADLAGSYKVLVGDEVKRIEGEAQLYDPQGKLISSSIVDQERIKRNMRILENEEGCKLLGTILPPYPIKDKGRYVLKLGESEVTVEIV